MIRIIYDWRREDDKHVLMTAFTERDVLAGDDVSGNVRRRVLINQATGVNPKPWLKDGRFLGLKTNEDGAAFLAGPRAELEPVDGEVRPVEVGKRIFNDRPYTFHDQLPECVRDRGFVFSSIDRSSARVKRPGVVYALTPALDRNRDSQADALTRQGFVRAAVPELLLFLNHRGHAVSGNVVTLFQRRAQQGESLRLGKWAVIVF